MYKCSKLETGKRSKKACSLAAARPGSGKAGNSDAPARGGRAGGTGNAAGRGPEPNGARARGPTAVPRSDFIPARIVRPR